MKIDRYEVVREIGRGAMATVYLAHDPLFGRPVAIKTLSHHLSQNPAFRMQFEQEVKVMARLEHPFIVPVYDYGEHAGQLYFVMRYISGGTLGNWAGDKPKPLVEVIPVIERLASALDAVHRHGVIHRDLNPRNVLLDSNGFVFLADFGIAKPQHNGLTPAPIVGTPEYISPEQAAGCHNLDGRSDVYSLGVLVYQLLSGEAPYSAATPSGTLHHHIHSPSPKLNTDRLGLPAECKMILARTLAKQPEARYASAGEFANALRGLRVDPTSTKGATARLRHSIWVKLSGAFVRKRPSQSFQTIWSWDALSRFHPAHKRGHRALLVGSIAVLPLLIGLVWWAK